MAHQAQPDGLASRSLKLLLRWVFVRRIVLALAGGVGLAAASAQAAVATATCELGGSGTFFAGDVYKTWIAKGTPDANRGFYGILTISSAGAVP